MSELVARGVSVAGIATLLGIAWALSSDRRRVPWRVVGVGLTIQLVLAVVLLHTPPGRWFFAGMNRFSDAVLAVVETGSRFVFGALYEVGPSFLMTVFPIIIFMGSVFGILYHLGVAPWVVGHLSRWLGRSMGLSGAESLAAVANVFVGMSESALVVRPYVEGMTRSELFTLMTTGMATVAGSVLFAYVTMLGGGDYAGHLVTASLLSAPAAIVIAKIMIPESETPRTQLGGGIEVPRRAVNAIDAASLGAIDGLRIGATVGAMLIAFVALVAMANALLAGVGGWVGLPNLSFEMLLGVLLAPLAWLLGVPWADAPEIGALLGVKTVLNEFLAYEALGELVTRGAISERSAVIASYALCGFANFGSLAILLGAIGALAPSRRGDLAELGVRSIIAGSLATFLTGALAGLIA